MTTETYRILFGDQAYAEAVAEAARAADLEPAATAPGRHRGCLLHPKPGEYGVTNAPGEACPTTCWTRGTGRVCESFGNHRPGYDVSQGESRYCPDCERYEDTCCEDHCLECGSPT